MARKYVNAIYCWKNSLIYEGKRKDCVKKGHLMMCDILIENLELIIEISSSKVKSNFFAHEYLKCKISISLVHIVRTITRPILPFLFEIFARVFPNISIGNDGNKNDKT